jgi:transcription elongation factor Elf1
MQFMSTNTLPRVATNINVFCKKCDADRYFKVITHTSETSAKLKCEVCGASQKFSLEKEAKPAKAASTSRKAPAKPRMSSKSGAKSMWLNLQEQHKGQAIPYTIATEFRDSQSIAHPSFGVGYVTKTHAHKIEVLFAEGTKELMHARK